jgi:HAD superfamily hydrolase (TIGR01509 family)
MRRAALDRYLDATLSNEDVASPKPDPAIYIKAMEMLGAKPHEMLVVEDNEHGIRAARAAGAHVMVVEDVEEVNLGKIRARIAEAERALERVA